MLLVELGITFGLTAALTLGFINDAVPPRLLHHWKDHLGVVEAGDGLLALSGDADARPLVESLQSPGDSFIKVDTSSLRARLADNDEILLRSVTIAPRIQPRQDRTSS